MYEIQQADGQVGEETNSKLMTLVGATRHTGRPMSVMVEGSSSAGKSDILKRQIKCLPPHFVRELQSMSERALAYMGKDALRDTFLTVFELGGLGGDGKESLEMTKQLLTEGCIKRQIAESTPKGVRGRLIEVEGPTALWTTTTKTIIDHELSTRAFKITADNSPATTRGVLVSIFDEERPPADYEPVKSQHTWLEAQDNRVRQPFGKALAELLPNSAVRMRRDAARLRDLISAHAILHQATRRRDAEGRIIATFEDYEAVRKLLDNIIGVAAEKSVSPTVRETVELAKELIDEDKPVTAYTLKDKLGISREQASRRLGAAKGAGYLKHDENADGKQKVYVLGEALPDEGTVLPSVEELKREVCICASESRREGSGQDHDENCPVVTCTLDAHVHTQSEESVFSEEEKADKYEEYSEDATVQTDEPPPSGNQTHTCTVTRTECLTPDLCMDSCAKCAQLTPEQEEGWEAIVVLWELEKGLPISRGQADDWMIVKFWEVEMATGIDKVAKVIEYCNDPYELSPSTWQRRVIREIGVKYDHATIIIAMHQARLKATDSEWASIAIRYLEEDGYFAIPRCLSEIHSEVEFGFDIYVPDYIIADACDEEGIMYEEDYRYVEEERDIADLVREEEMYDGVPPETYA